jgi:hypothetical protein
MPQLGKRTQPRLFSAFLLSAVVPLLGMLGIATEIQQETVNVLFAEAQ